MVKNLTLLVFLTVIAVGCAHIGDAPTSPQIPTLSAQNSIDDSYKGPYRSWGEWDLYFNENHDSVDAVPRRSARLHLNSTKFLESYCTDCLKIKNIKNNGDETIDLTITIAHPFSGHPEFTGFDVKGIIMFEGSHEIPDNIFKYPLYPQNFRASWRLLGDPEVLNADGYTYRWSPWYDSGSTLPIFNYWPGKFSNGTPTANINAFLNFYSMEERHIFESDAKVERTYTIFLPPGPVIAGYAIEACWEPPVNTPVDDPVNDFPITANQPECYSFNCVLNDGLPVTSDDPCCNITDVSIHEARAEIYFWYIHPDYNQNAFQVGSWCEEFNMQKVGYATNDCDSPDPEHFRCMVNHNLGGEPDGTYQVLGVEYHYAFGIGEKVFAPVFTLFEVTIDFD